MEAHLVCASMSLWLFLFKSKDRAQSKRLAESFAVLTVDKKSTKLLLLRDANLAFSMKSSFSALQCAPQTKGQRQRSAV